MGHSNDARKGHLLFVQGYVNHLVLSTENKLSAERDYKIVIELYDQAIELGHAPAMDTRAWMYKYGVGGPVNYPKAIELYGRAIELGYAPAMNNLAYMYLEGQVGPVDYTKAIELFDRAIELGNADAMNNRAWIYQRYPGAPNNNSKAIELYDRAIELGHAPAMNNRAWMYMYGHGGPIDYPNAARLYRQSYENGSDLTYLSNVAEPPFKYHLAMAKNEVSTALILLENHLDELLIEFIVFDCNKKRNSPENLKRIQAILEGSKHFEEAQKTKLYVKTLTALGKWVCFDIENRRAIYQVKQDILNQLPINLIVDDDLQEVIQATINTWCGVGRNFVRDAANIIYRCIIQSSLETLSLTVTTYVISRLFWFRVSLGKAIQCIKPMLQKIKLLLWLHS